MRTPIPRADLLKRKSRPSSGERPYTQTEIDAELAELTGWVLRNGAIERGFAFRDYYETIAFVNALAWVIHAEDHHPGLVVEYNRCTVRFDTHSIGGISDNDFICAAKTDAVFARSGN